MNDVHEINDLLSELKNEIDKGINLEISEEKNGRYKNYYEYLTNLKKKIANDKLKFVFIGEKGKGKTTTILNLFKLVLFEKELLATGSGGTTVCEVELQKSKDQESFIEIIPIDDKYMDQYIFDFCSTYKKVEESFESSYVPTEIARSIRNMLGMKISEIKDWYATINNFDLFLSEVYKKIQLEERTETIIKCQIDANNNYFNDIQRKFNQINLGKIESIKIPKKIILHLTEDIIDFSNLESVSTIVDTRGIDSNINKDKEGIDSNERDSFRREDILNYLDQKADESIFLFIDGIKAAPAQNILDTIRSRITKENADRYYLFINIYHDEAENVMTDDGPAETIENGVLYKREDIITKFRQEKIPFRESNLIFYNSKKDYPSSSEILDSITANIKNSKVEVLELSEDVMTAFYKLKYDHENKERALEYFEELYDQVSNVYPDKNIVDDISNDFINDRMSKVHSSRLNAINRSQGDYVQFNFYHHFSLAIERVFDRTYLEAKNDVLKKVNEFLKYRNITKLEEIDYKAFLNKVQRDYLEQRSLLSSLYKKALLSNFNKDSWKRAVGEYGRGSGRYTMEVCEIYLNEIQLLNEELPFKDLLDKSWKRITEGNNLVRTEIA